MPAKPSAVVDTRVIYCGNNLDQLRKLPDAAKVPRVKLGPQRLRTDYADSRHDLRMVTSRHSATFLDRNCAARGLDLLSPPSNWRRNSIVDTRN